MSLVRQRRTVNSATQRSESSSGYTQRLVELVAEHRVGFAKQAERLVFLVEQVVDAREQARARAESVVVTPEAVVTLPSSSANRFTGPAEWANRRALT
jgi:hypothetical protein